MCLIIAKPKGQPLPDAETFENAWANNHDGFGLAWADGKTVHILKGAMKLNQVYKMLHAIPNIESVPMIMHFRFATEGRIDAGNCHPFPLSQSITMLRATQADTHVAVAHNGVIDFSHSYMASKGYTFASGYSPAKAKLSDSADFVRDFLARMPVNVLTNPGVMALIEEYTLSKFALLTPEGIYTIGSFIEDKHLLYSNGTYKYNLYDQYAGFGVRSTAPYVSAASSKDMPPDTDARAGVLGGCCDCCGNYSTELYEIDASIVCPDCARYFR